MKKIKQFFKELLWVKDNRHLKNITLHNIERKLIQYGFPNELRKEMITALRERIVTQGEKEFQIWFSHLYFSCPEEFQDELDSIQLYDTYPSWFEKEIKSLELKYALSWKTQTEDIKHVHEKARKVQHVIRQRLSDIYLDMIDH